MHQQKRALVEALMTFCIGGFAGDRRLDVSLITLLKCTRELFSEFHIGTDRHQKY